MEAGTIAAIVLSILLVILGLAFSGLLKKYKQLSAQVPFVGPIRPWSVWIDQTFGPTGTFFATLMMYMPNALLLFGIIADILSQNYRYSSASVLGILSTIINIPISMFFKKIFVDGASSAPAARAAPAPAPAPAPAARAAPAPAPAARAAPAAPTTPATPTNATP